MSRNVLSFLLIAGLSCMLLISCREDVSPSEIYGTYEADYKFAMEKLIVSKDGTFIQEVSLKSASKVDKAKGHWNYNARFEDICFDQNYMIVVGAFGFQPGYAKPPNEKSLACLSIGKYSGHVKIGIGDDPDGAGFPVYIKVH